MPAPTTYNEAGFASYLTSVLGELAAVIGWDAGSPQVREAVSDALLDLGVTSIGDVTTPSDIRGLRALGRRAIWRAVVQATAGKYDFSDSDAKFSRSQINSQALEALKIAAADCIEFDPNYSVSAVSVKRPHDPYVVIPDTERTA
jgi:hypothetical protein